jgi:hypothetical protein
MSKHVSELTMEELAQAGAEAAARAVAEAVAAGVTVTGYLPDDEGNIWLVRRAPNGAVDWIEMRYRREAGSDGHNELMHGKQLAG